LWKGDSGYFQMVAGAYEFCFCSDMPDERTPIGHMHARDFAPMRTQVPLSDLRADEAGWVRFTCKRCPRTGKVRLEALKARFSPDEGLVDILNMLLPADCPHAEPNAWDIRSCGWRYRDLR
jgi:hypothetical protein